MHTLAARTHHQPDSSPLGLAQWAQQQQQQQQTTNNNKQQQQQQQQQTTTTNNNNNNKQQQQQHIWMFNLVTITRKISRNIIMHNFTYLILKA